MSSISKEGIFIIEIAWPYKLPTANAKEMKSKRFLVEDVSWCWP
jgi:hypothetical protein